MRADIKKREKFNNFLDSHNSYTKITGNFDKISSLFICFSQQHDNGIQLIGVLHGKIKFIRTEENIKINY